MLSGGNGHRTLSDAVSKIIHSLKRMNKQKNAADAVALKEGKE